MKSFGVVLLVLQAISLLGAIGSGEILQLFQIEGTRDIGNMIGFFLPSLIGVILIVKGKKKVGENK